MCASQVQQLLPVAVEGLHCRLRESCHKIVDFAQGTSYGAPCELENVLAKIVIDRVPSIEMVRFVNSGTEACLSVLRLMRAYTKRDKVRLHAVDSCNSPAQ